MKTLIIDYKDEGKKISTYLTSIYPNLNVNHLYKALRKKDIKLNGKRISSNEVLHYNDELQVYITDSILNGIKLNIEITTIYEDDNIAIFNKPVDLEVTGDNSLSSILTVGISSFIFPLKTSKLVCLAISASILPCKSFTTS